MIYFIQQGNAGPIKIGFSQNSETFKKRLTNMQIANPDNLNLLKTIEGSRSLEFRLHDSFQEFLVRGEWFKPSDKLLAFIQNPNTSNLLTTKPQKNRRYIKVGTKPKYHCENCGYEWFGRVKTPPKACPACKRYDWDREKK